MDAEFAQRRDNAVAGVGIIETGLGGRERRRRSNIDDHAGRVLVQKCEVNKSGLRNSLKRVSNRCSGIDGVKTTLLHPMKITIPEGSITAIIGKAESGKSTLLKFMAGCLNNNVECIGDVNLPGTRSYLPPESNLHRFYTPRTYIKHYDKLLSSSKLMINEDIERLLDSLRIDYNRRDTIVGDAFRRGLSVEEKRRLELGLMVLSGPDTLFCENPVQGLDSETSLHIMEFLKGYCCNSSRRVVVTVNKPSNFIWNLIDNVILLSHGHIVYEGPRFDMEAFFAHNGMPTPKRFSPVEHYLAAVNNFRRPSAALNWADKFNEWQKEAEEDEGDELGVDVETCYPSMVPHVDIPRRIRPSTLESGMSRCNKLCRFSCKHKYPELVKRYLLQMLFNPGILQLRLGMYTMLALFLGALFWNLEKDYKDHQSIDSHAALLFYSSSFYIFMVCVNLPFLAIDLQIRNKEVLNGFYHPIIHFFAVSISIIPACLILSFVISVIQVNMVGLQNGIEFFLILTLALWCADALAILVSLWTPNFTIGLVLYAVICGLFMALEGFMLVPSKFPLWLRWSYTVPFHTYIFQSLMLNEFNSDSLGSKVLISYEIEDTSIRQDLIVLFCYGLSIHLLCLLKIAFGHTRRMKKRLKEA